MDGNSTKAIGTVASLQKGSLSKTFAPEALMVAAITLNELCVYPKSLQILDTFKREYQSTFIWLRDHEDKGNPATGNLYSLAIAFAKGAKTDVPERISSERIRSPSFLTWQEEINFLFARKRALPGLRLSEGDMDGAAAGKWNESLDLVERNTPQELRSLRVRIDRELGEINKRMYSQLTFVIENNELVDAEISNGASQDVVWQNVHPDYAEMVNSGKFPPERGPSGFSPMFINGAWPNRRAAGKRFGMTKRGLCRPV